MEKLFARFIREDEGQNLVEYALLAGLVALVALGAITGIGTRIGEVYTSIQNSLNSIALP